MSSRRPARVLIAIAALGASLAACDSLIGLGNYSNVDCLTDCSAVDSGGATADDSSNVFDSTLDALETGALDAGEESDATVDDAPSDAGPPRDVSVDAPSLAALWAQWKMPNPDAAIAPDSSTLLPNQMAYDLGPDGGAATAYDTVTKLTWVRQPMTVSSYSLAANYCATFAGYQVPTRIQLVSLIDFTRKPTFNATAFPQLTSESYWTASLVHGQTGPPGYWTVNFGNGLTSNTQSGAAVLCVKGGP